jgi:5-methylthioadenosine/S-adenosylhomocysteine deaminase
LRGNERCAKGSCIVPGFVNSHTHLAYTALRNQFDDLPFFGWIRKLTEIKYQKLTDADIAISTRLGIQECLRSGITTVADMSDFEVSLRELSASPLRGIFYWEIFGVEKDEADRSWKDLLQLYPRFVAEFARPGLHIGVSPHACYTVRPELYSLVAEWAIREQIPISFHLSESKEEEQFIGKRSGVIQDYLQQRAADWVISGNSSVEHLEKTGIFQTKPLLAHLVQVSESDMNILARYRISVAHCPKSNSKFGHGIAPILEILQHGLTVGLGTDSACSNNRLDLLEESRFALLQQRARAGSHLLSEEKMLEMLTLGGATALGLSNEIGSLDAGKEADLVFFQFPDWYHSADQVLYHLIHNATPSNIQQTIIAGRKVEMTVAPEEVSAIYRKLR